MSGNTWGFPRPVKFDGYHVEDAAGRAIITVDMMQVLQPGERAALGQMCLAFAEIIEALASVYDDLVVCEGALSDETRALITAAIDQVQPTDDEQDDSGVEITPEGHAALAEYCGNEVTPHFVTAD